MGMDGIAIPYHNPINGGLEVLGTSLKVEAIKSNSLWWELNLIWYGEI